MDDLKDQTIGFIGLGLMGKPMARNLKAAGADLVVFNRSKAVVEELSAEGMASADSPRAAAQQADTVIAMVTDTPSAEAVLAGPDGVLSGLSDGMLVIDMGTTAVSATRALAAKVRAAGAEYVDAPVSGGQVGAEAGSLSIMAGGSDEAFARAEPIFRVLGDRVTHVGDVGAGQVAKCANQVIVALTIGAVAEAFTLARGAGVDPAKVREALIGGFATSRILDLHGQRMVEGNFTPGGRARVQLKDINQALDLAGQSGADLPATKLSQQLYEKMVEMGYGDLDHSGLIKIFDTE